MQLMHACNIKGVMSYIYKQKYAHHALKMFICHADGANAIE